MRTLPLRLAPLAGESLPGYLGRYAAGFGFAPGEVAEAFGLVGEERFDGLRLSPAQAERAAAVSGIGPEELRAMTLERHAGSAFSLEMAGGESRLPRSVLAQEVSVFSSRACPACLREHGTWLLRWQLGWSLLCTRHRVLLLNACPSCGGRIGAPRRVRWPGDERGELRDPCACRGRMGELLCRERLVEASAVRLAGDRDLVAAQLRLDAVLDGKVRPRLAGKEVDPLAWLHDLRALALLLRGYPEFVAARPRSLRHEAARQRDARGRLLLSPAALAAVLPEAMRLADLPDEDALVDALREVLERRYRADGATLPKLHRQLRSPSGRLAGALRLANQTAGFAHVSTRMGIDPLAHRRPGNLDPRLEARHVPQLFWAEDYERALEPLFDFDDFSPWFGRRFCSALLARMLAPLDWRGAVRRLELPGNYRHGGYQGTLWKLRREGRAEELVARIKAAANEHAARGPLIDYERRRGQLSDWKGIDPECWLYLQPVRRPERWRVDPPKRRAHASIWLWCELTSGHERAAPIPLPGRAGKDLNEHTNFRHRFLPPLRERLLILGELLLVTPADARSTLPTQLAAALRERGRLAADLSLDEPDPLIADRVLALVGAHTGVDIATLTTPTVGSRAPAAVTHARLLAAALLRQTTLASWTAIGGILGGYKHRLSTNHLAYRDACERDPALAAELEMLATRVGDWREAVPDPPASPHGERMREVAASIRCDAAEIFGDSGLRSPGLHASLLTCREHTDLTWAELAEVHRLPYAQPQWSRGIVVCRRADRQFQERFEALGSHAAVLREKAGFADAQLTRGLVTS